MMLSKRALFVLLAIAAMFLLAGTGAIASCSGSSSATTTSLGHGHGEYLATLDAMYDEGSRGRAWLLANDNPVDEQHCQRLYDADGLKSGGGEKEKQRHVSYLNGCLGVPNNLDRSGSAAR